MLSCTELVQRYDDLTAVDGIDLRVRAGECFGLLGPNGAGKTTTVEIFEGLKKPTGGVVELFGVRWGAGRDPHLRSRFGVQLQEARFPDKLTVEETIKLFRSFYRAGHDVEELLDMVDLQEKRRARLMRLSGGQRQRLALACALAGKPDLLFLDEPTTGLDPQVRHNIWKIIERFKAGGGSVLLTTHYMEEAARLCDRVAIMDHGRIIAEGTPPELIKLLGADQIIEFSVKGEMNGEVLRTLPGVRDVTVGGGVFALTVSEIGAALPALLSEIERQRAELITMTTHQATLEDVFIKLTGRRLGNGGS
ncbi:MAG TPA: ABC transporter ATP-binding protein [Pyrinomonadaceae bacterium]|nr:ABC transporter ATP-binding protein [Pyrinomonadaceae bacterium]